MKKILSLTILVLSMFVFVGCGQQVPNVSVKDIVKDINGQIIEDMKAAGVSEDMFKDGMVPGYMEADLTSETPGPISELFNKEDIEEGIVLQQMINIKSDLIIVIKAKDESKVADLETALEKVKEGQINTWEQYLPDQYEKVKNNIIKSKGKYLIYITYDNPEKLEEIFDNYLK